MSGTLLTTVPQWTWTGAPANPVVIGYGPNQSPTKTGLLPTDLQAFVGVPIQIYSQYGVPPAPVDPLVIMKWIRWAEDAVEQDTTVRLCPTWIAAPAATMAPGANHSGLLPANGLTQALGVDYDLAEPAYDFRKDMTEDNGWQEQRLRWRPVKDGPNNYGLKNYAYIYPLLNSYMKLDASWFVIDQDYGIIRIVPTTNIQMLPLYALQLAFSGNSDTVPGGLWLQYIAGLTRNDLNSEYSFMNEYVLCIAAITALSIVQGSISFGVVESTTSVDGLTRTVKFSAKGPYSGIISQFMAQSQALRKLIRSRMGGVTMVLT